MRKIEIPLSKTKNILLLIGAAIFVTFGVLFIITPGTFVSALYGNSLVIRTVGIGAVLFFGTIGIYGLRKLFDTQMGLIIDEQGIYDHTNASSIGLIKWTDIKEIKTEQIAATKFLLIYITNPDHYLDKVKGFKRKLMEGNTRIYGTPLSITSVSLKCNFNDLEKLTNESFIEQSKRERNG